VPLALWLLAPTLTWGPPVGIDLAAAIDAGRRAAEVRVPSGPATPPIEVRRGASGRVRGFVLGGAQPSCSSGIDVEN